MHGVEYLSHALTVHIMKCCFQISPQCREWNVSHMYYPMYTEWDVCHNVSFSTQCGILCHVFRAMCPQSAQNGVISSFNHSA